MYDFFKSDSLTDVTLVNPINKATYRVHRVIVSSGSRYLLEVFMKYSVAELPKLTMPEPFNQKNELHSDDQCSRILKYIYANQVSIPSVTINSVIFISTFLLRTLE